MPASSPNDPTLVRAIAAAAHASGADAALMVATSMVESGLRWRPTPGDNGTSFGPFQHHEGGALGSHPPSWASTTAAVQERARAFAAAGASSGAGAAAVQRPRDQAAYAAKVNALLPQARALLARDTSSTTTRRTTTTAPPQTMPAGARVVQAAQNELGVPYKWGGAAPATGFDCSGLVRWALAKVGVNVTHNAADQFNDPKGKPVGGGSAAQAVSSGALKPGDVVFFRDTDGPGITHNGIYAGAGQFIEAPHTGDVVKRADLTSGYYADHYAGARRFVAAGATVTTVGGRITVPTSGGGGVAGAAAGAVGGAAGAVGGAVGDVVGGAGDVASGVAGIPGAIAGLPADLQSAAEAVGGWSLENVILPSLFVLGGLGLALYGLSHAFGGGGQGGSRIPTLVLGRGAGGAGGGSAPAIPLE